MNKLIFVILLSLSSSIFAHKSVVVIPLGGDASEPLHNVIRVSKSNGDFKTLNLALASINNAGDASVSNPYLVVLGPGTYTEGPLNIPAHVSSSGSGRGITTLFFPDNQIGLPSLLMREGYVNLNNLSIQIESPANPSSLFLINETNRTEDEDRFDIFEPVSLRAVDLRIFSSSERTPQTIFAVKNALELTDVELNFDRAMTLIDQSDLSKITINSSNFFGYFGGANVDLLKGSNNYAKIKDLNITYFNLLSTFINFTRPREVRIDDSSMTTNRTVSPLRFDFSQGSGFVRIRNSRMDAIELIQSQGRGESVIIEHSILNETLQAPSRILRCFQVVHYNTYANTCTPN